MDDYTPNLYGRDVVLISDADALDETICIEDLQEETQLINSIRDQLAAHNVGFTSLEVANIEQLAEELSKFKQEEVVIFNWCEEVTGISNTPHLITKFLEENNYIFTGASTEILLKEMDKTFVKETFLSNNVNTPKYYELEDITACSEIEEFPVIVKSKKEHGSFALGINSIVENTKELINHFSHLKKTTKSDFIAEQFIHGREFVVSIWGNNNPEVLPILELYFDSQKNNKYKFLLHESKWDRSSPHFKGIYVSRPRNLDKKLEKKLENIAINAYKSLDACGFARLEIRVDENNEPYVIDFNSNPTFRPGTSFLISTEIAGYNYGETVAKMCEFALIRELL